MKIRKRAYWLIKQNADVVEKTLNNITDELVRDTVLAEMFRWVAVLNKFRRAL